jgi:hypothetical protein
MMQQQKQPARNSKVSTAAGRAYEVLGVVSDVVVFGLWPV